jgi:hypothetical protein
LTKNRKSVTEIFCIAADFEPAVADAVSLLDVPGRLELVSSLFVVDERSVAVELDPEVELDLVLGVVIG